jgi:hypothetical protein
LQFNPFCAKAAARVEIGMVSMGFLPAALLAFGDLPPVAPGDHLGARLTLAAAAAEGVRPDQAVARIVQSLVEYTRWPEARSVVRLCVVGPTAYAGRLDGLRLADGRSIERRAVIPGLITAGACDAVYMGQLPPAAQRQITAQVRGRGVMTIAEADPQCRSQAMFCLSFMPQAVSFRLNLDAVARSGLRVDPRVLRLSAGQP